MKNKVRLDAPALPEPIEFNNLDIGTCFVLASQLGYIPSNVPTPVNELNTQARLYQKTDHTDAINLLTGRSSPCRSDLCVTPVVVTFVVQLVRS